MGRPQPNRILGGDGQRPSTVEDCRADYQAAQTAHQEEVAHAYGIPVLDDDADWQPPGH